MNAPIYYVGGSKGGVGKSQMSFVLLDYLVGKGKQVFLVESDNSNPDVYKAHQPCVSETLICEIMNLDSVDGWLNLVDRGEDFPEYVMVINSAARSNVAIAKYGATLKETLPQIQRELITFWMMNRQRDSVELLRDYINSIPDAKIFGCRNLFFGEASEFKMYNASRIKEVLESNGGGTLDFPALSPRVADKIYSERIPIWMADKQFRISERVELSRWKNLCAKLFDRVIGGNEA